MKRRFSFAFTLILGISSLLRAEFFVGPGATGATFLKIPMAARANALAGAFTAVPGDAAAIEYNPAGLVEMNNVDINATYIKYLEDASLQSATIGFPVSLRSRIVPVDGEFTKDRLFVGLHYRSFRADDTERDSLGNDLGGFHIQDQDIQLAFAYALHSRLSIGASAKYLSHKIKDNSANNLAGDLGLLFKLRPHWHVGASVLNYGSDKKFIEEKDPLPTMIRVGTSYESRQYLLVADLSEGRDKIMQKAGGVEWKVNRYVRLRGGMIHTTQVDFAAGVGFDFGGPANPVEKTAEKPAPQRTTLEDVVFRNKNDPANSLLPTNIRFGLDYAVRTHADIGLAHTFTFRILY